MLEESIRNLTFQQDTYLFEFQKDYVSLTGIGNDLSAFNIPCSLSNKVILLVRDIENKDKALASAQATLIAAKASLSLVQ